MDDYFKGESSMEAEEGTTLPVPRGHFPFLTREQEICRLGWLLLFMWLVMIIYMTKEIWCRPRLFSCTSREPLVESDTSSSATTRDKRRAVEESCESIV